MAISREPLGYITGVKSAVVSALRDMYPKTYVLDGRGLLNVNIEYPMTQGEYPAIFVEYEQEKLQASSVSGFEYGAEGDDIVDLIKRWVYAGSIKCSFYSLKAKERDLLVDGFIKLVGFSDDFKEALRKQEYIRIEPNFAELNNGGGGQTPGTPWGGDELVYWSTLDFDVVGDFFTEYKSAAIISRVDAYPRFNGEPDLPDSTDGNWI